MPHYGRNREALPACENLEGRLVLSAAPRHPANPAAAERAAIRAVHAAESAKLNYDFGRLTQDVHRMQAGSRVTPAEIAALGNDLYALSSLPQTTPDTLSPQGNASNAADIIYHIDYAFTAAYNTPQGWATRESELASDFAATGVQAPQGLMDPLMADLKAIALAADVSPNLHNQYFADANTVNQDQAVLPNSPDSMDPLTYFNDHLSGFVAGGKSRHFSLTSNQLPLIPRAR